MLGASPKENGERKEQDGRKGSSHGRVLIDCESGPGMESKTRSAFNDRECTKVPFDASPLRTPERENRSWSSWCDRLRFSCDPLSFVVSVEFPLSVRPLSRVVFPFRWWCLSYHAALLSATSRSAWAAIREDNGLVAPFVCEEMSNSRMGSVGCPLRRDRRKGVVGNHAVLVKVPVGRWLAFPTAPRSLSIAVMRLELRPLHPVWRHTRCRSRRSDG